MSVLVWRNSRASPTIIDLISFSLLIVCFSCQSLLWQWIHHAAVTTQTMEGRVVQREQVTVDMVKRIIDQYRNECGDEVCDMLVNVVARNEFLGFLPDEIYPRINIKLR